jgi:hypothetical protein
MSAATTYACLEAVARQQAEHESRWRQLLNAEARRRAAVYEEEACRRDWQSRLAFLRLENESLDHFTSSLEREAQPATGEIARASDQPPPSQARLEFGGQVKLNRYAGATMPLAPSPELNRKIAAIVEDPDLTHASRVLATGIGKETQNNYSEETPGRVAASELIAQLASSSATSLPWHLEEVTPKDASPTRKRQHTQTPADALTQRHLRAQVEAGPDAGEALALHQDRYHGPLRLIDQELEPSGLTSGSFAGNSTHAEPAIYSFLADVDDVLSQIEEQAQASTPRMNLDGNEGWNNHDRPFSSPNTNASVQDALAAATNEVERLRAAVRQTIDELERVRGLVQPTMPGLPVNRGAYRIS